MNEEQLGQYLLTSGVLSREQLDDALGRQSRMARLGFDLPIGEVVLRMGIADPISVETALLRQRLDNGAIDLGSVGNWAPFRTDPEAEPAAAPQREDSSEPRLRRLRLLAQQREAGSRASGTPTERDGAAQDGAKIVSKGAA